GTVLVLQCKQTADENAIRKAVDPISKDKVVQIYGPPTANQIMVRLPMGGVEQGASLEEGANKIEQSLRGSKVGDFTVIKKELVGPTVGADLQRKGIYALFAALGGIL